MTMRRVMALFVIAACGPKPPPSLNPVLPGDGDANVAKPTTPKNKVDDPWTGKELISPPPVRPVAAVELPPMEEAKLSNGLPVYLIKSSRLPTVSIQLAIKAGRGAEPRARLGVAEITADMLVKGTQRRDAASLAKTIDSVGGTIAADATFEATLLSCAVLAKSTQTCLDLLPEMVTQPTFVDSELTKIKDRMIQAVRQRYEDPGTLASAHVQNLLWGNEHVRGWINSEASIAAIRREDVVAWHKAWFVPANAILVVSGDFDPKKMKADLERAFGGWKKGPVPPTPTYPEPGLAGIRIRLVDKPGMAQAHVRIAQFGIKHDDARFFDTLVWNHVLTTRLAHAARGDGTKPYAAASSFDRNMDRGSFVAQTFARSADAIALTKTLMAEIAKMHSDGPTKDEVTAAVANLAGTYEVRFQSAADVGAALVGAELHGYGQQYLQNYPIALGNVDPTSAKQTAGDILDPKNFVIVIVGDAKDLEPLMKKEGWRYEKLAFNEPIGTPIKEPEIPVDAKTSAVIKKIVDDAIAAKGGKDKLAAIKGMRMVATGTTVIQGHTIPVDVDRVFVLPDKIRIDATLHVPGPSGGTQDAIVIYAADGKTGWRVQPSQNGPQLSDLAPGEIAQVDFERWREPELILLRALEPNAHLGLSADEVIDGKPHNVIKLGSPLGIDISLYIDKKTKLVTRMLYSDSGISNTDDFGDYKDVSGIKIAHKRTSAAQGRTTTYSLTKVELDPKLEPDKFKKPKAP
jgi:zinc protease